MILNIQIPSKRGKKLTNGEIIKAIFNGKEEINELLGENGTVYFITDNDVVLYDLSWWNKPYELKEVE